MLAKEAILMTLTQYIYCYHGAKANTESARTTTQDVDGLPTWEY